MKNTSNMSAMTMARSERPNDLTGSTNGETRLRLKLELLEERVAPYVVKMIDKMSPK